MGNENSGKIGFFNRIHILLRGRMPMTQVAKESAAIRGLRSTIKVLETINDKQSEMMDKMADQLSTQQEGSAQDKIINMVGEFFLSKKTNTSFSGVPLQPSSPQKGLPKQENVDLSDEQISKMIGQYPAGAIKSALLLGEDVLKNKIKEHYPDLSEGTVERGIQLARTI